MVYGVNKMHFEKALNMIYMIDITGSEGAFTQLGGRIKFLNEYWDSTSGCPQQSLYGLLSKNQWKYQELLLFPQFSF